MQSTSYEDLTPDNFIFKESKDYKVTDSKSCINVSIFKPNIQMVRKVI